LDSHIVRGILIGGSIGVLAGVFGVFDMARGAALGMIAGFFAGWTLEKKRERERRKKP
jgi:membrane associated rhomboid family serine protease